MKAKRNLSVLLTLTPMLLISAAAAFCAVYGSTPEGQWEGSWLAAALFLWFSISLVGVPLAAAARFLNRDWELRFVNIATIVELILFIPGGAALLLVLIKIGLSSAL